MDLDFLRAIIALLLEAYLFSCILYHKEKLEEEFRLKLWLEQNRPELESAIQEFVQEVQKISEEIDSCK